MVSRIGRHGLAAVAATLSCLVSLPLAAGETWHGHRQDHHHGQDDRPAGITGSGLPSVLPGIGTYAGAVSAVSFRGVGTYFAIDRNGRRAGAIIPAPRALIIEVNAETSDAACSYEAGVCVIRP